MIHELKNNYRVADLCCFLKVSRSGYYAWLKTPVSGRQKENERLKVHIKASYQESHGTYGAIRVYRDLKNKSVLCGKNRVAKIMSNEGLKSIHKSKFKPCTTDSKHLLPIANNVIAQDFSVKGPNQKWGGDITYIPTAEGFMYLAIVLDFFSRKIIGFAIADRMTAELCIQALRTALAFRNPPKTLIHHSDRGSQYASFVYTQLIQSGGFVQSMSRRGNCYDNAMVESFFHTLKVEWVHRKKYTSKQQAKEDIQNYINNFYNRKRLHSALDYQSPNNYENINNNAA